MIVTIVASVVIAPVATSAIKRGTNIDENLAQSIYELLSNNKEIDNYFAEGNELPVNIDTSQIANYIKFMNVMIGEISDKVNLPESMTNTLKEIPVRNHGYSRRLFFNISKRTYIENNFSEIGRYSIDSHCIYIDNGCSIYSTQNNYFCNGNCESCQ